MHSAHTHANKAYKFFLRAHITKYSTYYMHCLRDISSKPGQSKKAWDFSPLTDDFNGQ
jgi:hypothetical protein